MTEELTLPIAIHLAAVLPAVVIGVIQLASEKGSRAHKALGRVWVLAMAVAALSSFWIHGINRAGGFSVIHLLSVWTLICLACAIYFVRRGNVPAHRGFMVGSFLGLAGAGIGALMPGRLVSRLLF